MLESLKYIAKINKRMKPYEMIKEKYQSLCDINISVEKPRCNTEAFSIVTVSAIDEHKPQKIIFLEMIAFLILIINTSVHYNICTFMPQNMGSDNIYTAALFLAIGELVAAFIATPISIFIKRRHLYISTSTIQLCIALILYFTNLNESAASFFQKFIPFILSISMKTIICVNSNILYTYGSEIFSTKYRANVLAVALLLGGISMSIVPYLMVYAKNRDIHPLTTGIPLAVISIGCAMYLPETLNVKVSN